MPDANLSIKVTTIGGKHCARLLKDGKVIDEMSCELKQDVGYICRTMLRWFCKMGGVSAWAESARRRMTEKPEAPAGRVRYHTH